MSENGENHEYVDDRERLSAEIPKEGKAILAEQEGFMWENITEAIFNTFGGERLSSPAALNRDIEELERKKRNAYERMQDAQNEYQRYDQQIKARKERREQMAEQAETKADALDQVLQSMYDHGSNVYVGHGSVKTLANKWFGGNEQAALDALKERSDEADYNFAENRFEEPSLNCAGSSQSLKSVGGVRE